MGNASGLGCAVIAGLAAMGLLSTCSVIAGLGQPEITAPQGTCGTGSLDVPAQARPWMQKAAQVSGLPEAYLAAIAKQESSFDPANFTNDSNGGTWGLFQINREEWQRFYPQGNNPNGTPYGITDPMIHAEVGGRYLKDRLENVKRLQAKNPDTEWGKLPELDALVIAHNAGEGNLMKYPAIPSITRGYLANMHKWFQPQACENPGGGTGGEVAPASGKIVSPIPEGTNGIITSARYGRYPSGGPHWGTDLSKGGDGSWTVQSICDGTVHSVDIKPTTANSNAKGVSGSTNYIWIDCGNRVFMGYAHFYAKDLNPALKPGVKVGAGTKLFPQGNQGNSSGSHVHLQISTIGSTAYTQAATVDAAIYLQKFGIRLPQSDY